MSAARIVLGTLSLCFLAAACAVARPEEFGLNGPTLVLVVAGLCGVAAVVIRRAAALAASAIALVVAGLSALSGADDIPWLLAAVFGMLVLAFVECTHLQVRARIWTAASARAMQVPYSALGSSLAGWIIVATAIPAGLMALYQGVALRWLPAAFAASIEHSAGWLVALGLGLAALVLWLLRSPWIIRAERPTTAPAVRASTFDAPSTVLREDVSDTT